jgi:hypothetical protein
LHHLQIYVDFPPLDENKEFMLSGELVFRVRIGNE